ncbi:MAG TPA: lysophospholipase [Dermatophilaceae bacterium]|nr:lysophospholipase [Dermatophilaceae bacterium]HOI03948.1 lysophospholipase [Dermatophilaceae bacterium]HOR16619.1 lysophospholipase [Dermatophilaceae bacterium]
MDTTTFTVTATDGTPLHVFRWLPDAGAAPKAVVQIAHGMAEHSARYARFAEVLTAAGYAVYAQDHRGHGQTAGVLKRAGFFAEHDGWSTVVEDMYAVTRTIREEQPGLPIFLFGHSMGSMLSRTYAIRHGAELDGLILSGTGGDPGMLGKVGQVVALVEAKVRGKGTASPLLDKLSFGNFNKPFEPARTPFEWLSRDPAEVDAYIADPWCGFVCTAGMFQDLLSGIALINADSQVARIPQGLPIYLFSGAEDPVGDKTKGVQQVVDQFRRLGIKDVFVRFYLGARHEVLNETNRDEVMADVVDWLDDHLSVTERA